MGQQHGRPGHTQYDECAQDGARTALAGGQDQRAPRVRDSICRLAVRPGGARRALRAELADGAQYVEADVTARERHGDEMYACPEPATSENPIGIELGAVCGAEGKPNSGGAIEAGDEFST